VRTCVVLFSKENVLISAHNTDPFTNRIAKKRKLRRNSKLVIIFFKTLGDPFVAVAEAASQSSSDAKAKLYKVEVAEEGLLLGESAKYTASQLHRSNPAPTTQHFFPTPATRAKLRFPPKIIFLEINRVISGLLDRPP
jgi:hypothetical protein